MSYCYFRISAPARTPTWCSGSSESSRRTTWSRHWGPSPPSSSTRVPPQPSPASGLRATSRRTFTPGSCLSESLPGTRPPRSSSSTSSAATSRPSSPRSSSRSSSPGFPSGRVCLVGRPPSLPKPPKRTTRISWKGFQAFSLIFLSAACIIKLYAYSEKEKNQGEILNAN